MSGDWIERILQALIALTSGGLLVRLFTLGPERKKLSEDAGVSSATAADLLTGRALQMVENAERRAARAEQHAERAETEAHQAQIEVRELRVIVDGLITYIRQGGLPVPDWIRDGKAPPG